MAPKKEHAEHEENGTNVERNTYDDPDTKTHAEEINRNHNRRNGEQGLASRPPAGKEAVGKPNCLRLPEGALASRTSADELERCDTIPLIQQRLFYSLFSPIGT